MIPEGEFKYEGGPLKPRRPWWLTLIIILLILPAFSTPWLLADAPGESILEMLVKWFPAFLLLAGACAWFAWPQRHDVAWILLVIMLLSDATLFML